MQKKQNDSLALIVGGLFILALLFTTYNYFNKGKSTQESVEQRIQELQSLNETESQNSESENQTDENSQEITEQAASDDRQEEYTNDKVIAETNNTMQDTEYSQWIANDYNKGDIEAGEYKVVEGDTLYEIAEAVYGDGSMWTEILASNSTDIGYLQNGQQALIVPGQILNIVQ